MACAMVDRSTYSSSLPAGTPRASRVTFRPRDFSACASACAVAVVLQQVKRHALSRLDADTWQTAQRFDQRIQRRLGH